MTAVHSPLLKLTRPFDPQELTSPKSFTTADPVLEAYKTYEIISNPFFTDSGAEDEEKEAFLAQAVSPKPSNFGRSHN